MGANKLNSEYGDLVAEYDELSDSDSYHAYDAQWSTEALDAESVTDTFKYTAFGLQTHETGTSDSPLTFVGKQSYWNDLEIELYFLGMGGQSGSNALSAKKSGSVYDPNIGARANPDPQGIDSVPGGKLYDYAENNPINIIDPSGQFPPFPVGGSFEQRCAWQANADRISAEAYRERWESGPPPSEADQQRALEALLRTPVEPSAKRVYGVDITFPDNFGNLKGVVQRLGGDDVRGLVYLGLEIAHRIAIIEDEIARLRKAIAEREWNSGKAVVSMCWPIYGVKLAASEAAQATGLCTTDKEMEAMIVDLEEARDELQAFFDEAGL